MSLGIAFDAAGGYGIGANTVTDVRHPKISRTSSPSQSLVRPKVPALLKGADKVSSRSAALVALLVLAGLRIFEVLPAKVDNLGYESGQSTLRIRAKGGAEVKAAAG